MNSVKMQLELGSFQIHFWPFKMNPIFFLKFFQQFLKSFPLFSYCFYILFFIIIIYFSYLHWIIKFYYLRKIHKFLIFSRLSKKNVLCGFTQIASYVRTSTIQEHYCNMKSDNIFRNWHVSAPYKNYFERGVGYQYWRASLS